MRVAKIELAGARGAPVARSSQGGIPLARRAKAAVGGDDHNLEHCTSDVTQAQLDNLRVALRIPPSISMRALACSELFHDVIAADNEIPFSVAVLECGVRLPLAPFLQ